MRLWASTFLIAITLLTCCADERRSARITEGAQLVPFDTRFDALVGADPIAIFLQTRSEREDFGSHAPFVAIYEDGLVLLADQDADGLTILAHKRLDADDLAAIRDDLAQMGNYSKLKRWYDLAPGVTHMPTSLFYLSLDDGEFATAVYGLMVPGTRLGSHSISPGRRKADRLPRTLEKLYDYMTAFDREDVTPWEARYVKVHIWGSDFSYNVDGAARAIQWPDEWPGLDSPLARDHRDGAHSIFLDRSVLPRLQTLFGSATPSFPVELGGHRWSASVSYVFPREPDWRHLFQAQ